MASEEEGAATAAEVAQVGERSSLMSISSAFGSSLNHPILSPRSLIVTYLSMNLMCYWPTASYSLVKQGMRGKQRVL